VKRKRSGSGQISEVHCAKCGKLLLKEGVQHGFLEIKCKKCGGLTILEAEEGRKLIRAM